MAVTIVASIVAAYFTVNAGLANSTRGEVMLPATMHGSVVETSPLVIAAPQIKALSSASARVVYRSTDTVSGRLVEVSGAFFVPTGRVPVGGWPVVAVAHRGVGIDEECAPTTTSTLLGDAPVVEALLKHGYAVTVTDYTGLGRPGATNDFLDVTGAGRNLIDSVRALRATFPDISSRWAAFGTGKGGAAVWAANQQSAGYAEELKLVGTAAISPMGDVSPILELAPTGRLTADQRRVLIWSLASLARQQPDLNLDDYRRGMASEHWTDVVACFGADVHRGNVVINTMTAADLSPATPEAAATMVRLLKARALPDAALNAPLSVVSEADDTVVAPRWSSDAIHNACARGGSVSWRTVFSTGQSNRLDGRRDDVIAAQISWLSARFAGDPAASECGSVPSSSAGAGAVVDSYELPDVAAALELPNGARAARVLYGSTEGDTGAPTVVSGIVFVPGGQPPIGGWPVLAYGHGTTGIDERCGPSVLIEKSTPWVLESIGPVINRLIGLGFAVTFADYEGLGAPGIHRYLDSRTAGLNIIDSVRALRAAFPGVSARWAAVGGSQGAGAVWAANEQSDTYAPELDLIGAVALAPPADITGIVDKVIRGDITADQLGVLQLILASWSRADPTVDIDQFRRGTASQNWDLLSSCPESDAASAERISALAALTPEDLRPATPAAANQLRQVLAERALAQHETSAPLFIVYGTADSFIDAAWTSRAILRACALGDLITFDEQNGRGHDDFDPGPAMNWLMDRFADKPAMSQCPKQL